MNFIGMLMHNSIGEVNHRHHIKDKHCSMETITANMTHVNHPLPWSLREISSCTCSFTRHIGDHVWTAFLINFEQYKCCFCFLLVLQDRDAQSSFLDVVFRLTSHSRTATVPQTDHEPRERSSWPPARPDWGRTGRAASRGQKSPTQLRQFSPTEQACMKGVTQTGRHHLWAQEVKICKKGQYLTKCGHLYPQYLKYTDAVHWYFSNN